jgi:hypothetical protein
MTKRITLFLARAAALGVALATMVSLGACTPPTAFEGEAQFPGGPRGCFDRCAQNNMDMGSFVYVGEFSTACACKPRLVAGPAPISQGDDEGAAVASAAGVELQRRRIEAAQRNSVNQSYGKPY